MDKLETKANEFVEEPSLRCQGMCKGSCSCPTGFCKCGISYDGDKEYETPDVEYFSKAA